MNENTTIEPYEIKPLTNLLMTIGQLPTSYLMSLTYEEQLLWFYNFLNNTIIPNINTTSEATQELQNLFYDMQDYINNYFDNLDVQEEINNKLDAMMEDGSLYNLIKNYIDPIQNAFEDRVDNKLLNQDNQIFIMDEKINNILSGTPTVVNNTSEMTDHSKIYINTNDGYWYYYNGTAWTQGGIYQGVATSNELEEINQNKGTFYHNEKGDTGGIQRIFYSYPFKKGGLYHVRIKFNEFHLIEDENLIVYSLSLTSTQSATPKNQIIQTDVKKGSFVYLYDYIFKCNVDSNYLYMYIRNITYGGDYDIDVTITQPIDKIIFDEDNFSFNENTKEISLIDKPQYTYFGNHIDIKENYFDVKLYEKINKVVNNTTLQGMSIFEDKLFQLQVGGTLGIYNFTNDTENFQDAIASCELGSVDPANHCNSCNFSKTFYNNNTIPLLYVNSASNSNDFRCFVENITLTSEEVEGVTEYTASSELIQTITLDQSNFENKGYIKYWGTPALLISKDNKYMYYFGSIYRTNGSMSQYDNLNRYIITKFEIPSLSSGEVTLTADNVIEQFTTEYVAEYTQGGTLTNDNIIYCFGTGTTRFPDKIGIWNVYSKSFVNLIDLTQTPIHGQEIEDCYIYNNMLYINTQSRNIYQINII